MKSTSGFDFDLLFVVSMTYCIGAGLPIFIQIDQCGGVMTSNRFFKDGGHRVGNLLPGSALVLACICLGMSMSNSTPNFEEISQFTDKISLFPVYEN